VPWQYNAVMETPIIEKANNKISSIVIMLFIELLPTMNGFNVFIAAMLFFKACKKNVPMISFLSSRDGYGWPRAGYDGSAGGH
jgi:hypothetical protein